MLGWGGRKCIKLDIFVFVFLERKRIERVNLFGKIKGEKGRGKGSEGA